jgi:hypothetical protein
MITYWISQVGPDDGVLATYEVTAPLSSRKRLYSYILDQNKPKGFPHLGPEFQWVFIRNKDFDPGIFIDQGFEVAHRGEFLTILHRPSSSHGSGGTADSPSGGKATLVQTELPPRGDS